MQHIVDIVMGRREMLREYFSLGISDDGLVETLPMLLRDYTPNLDKLPLFLMRLGPQVSAVRLRVCTADCRLSQPFSLTVALEETTISVSRRCTCQRDAHSGSGRVSWSPPRPTFFIQ